MPEFYYQIKSRHRPGEGWCIGNWNFPPLFSGKVEARDKKEAREKVCEEYDKQFPVRVLLKDLEKNEFLLHLKELKDDDHWTKRLWEEQICPQCKKVFTLIEKYQWDNPGGGSFCSDKCKERNYEERQKAWDEGWGDDRHAPVIYKITNKNTNMSYIGQTTQAFTLRWYQHFFQKGDTKFHKEIRNTKFNDWTFEVIEMVDRNDSVDERERHWIEKLNSIEAGYNSK